MTPLGIATMVFNMVVLAMVIRFILFPLGAEYLRRRKIKKVLAELDKSTIDNAKVVQVLKGVE